MQGTLKWGAHTMHTGGYNYVPAGVLQAGWAALEDVTMFVIFDARPEFVAASASAAGAREHLLTPHLDTLEMEWADPLSASTTNLPFRAGIFVKVLRHDPDTGASTHLTGSVPGWFGEGVEVHPVREESLRLSGDVNIAEVGGKPGYNTLLSGCYYSRPAGVAHGPLSTKNGGGALVHTDGPMGIDYQPNPLAKELIMSHLRSFPWS